MTEPIGEIVARIEHCLVDPKGEPGFSDDDLRALIASWRERGEALKPFAEMADSFDALRDYQDNYACPAKSKIEEDCERARAKVAAEAMRKEEAIQSRTHDGISGYHRGT